MKNKDDLGSDSIKEIAKIVSDIAGIQLGEKQYPMVESRLKSRIAKMGLGSAGEYLSYLKQNNETETEALLSLLTTHHTFFFREFAHFEYILNHQLKNLIAAAEKRKDKKIKVWSAACSRGQEVYSLAMFFSFHLKAIAPHIDFEIWGTDVDPESVETAKNGVYKSSDLNQSPAMYVADHWMQGKNEVKNFSKIKDSLRSKCKFATLNLVKTEAFAAAEKFDLILCRNVFIYFTMEQVKSISEKFLEKLHPHGSLILGVSESLQGLKLPVMTSGLSVYQKASATSSDLASKPAALSAEKKAYVEACKPAPVQAPRPLNILCVDDSKTIHALMKNILTKEHGFIIKHHAMNGAEALKLLETEKYDAITLDLHMPIVDGMGVLSQRKDKTPVVIVSSINREDESIARQAMKLGALDYVQKPTMDNLVHSGNEIRAKLKSVFKLSGGNLTEPKKTKAAA